MRRLLAVLIAAAVPSLLAGCSRGGSSCSENTRKADVLTRAESYYLFQELLPPDLGTIKLSDYATADDLLQYLTAQAQAAGKDRGWSYLMSEDAYNAYFSAGETIGYGFSFLVEGTTPDQHVLVKQVLGGSAADAAGFKRGDEILAVGPTAETEVPVANASDPSSLFSANGLAGVSKAWSVIPRGGGAPVDRTMVSAVYAIDPVPTHWVSGTTGYLQILTFIQPAESELRSVFADFKSQGVQNVVIDLRYNGGGSVYTAMVLADLLGTDLTGDMMLEMQFNANHPGDTSAYPFGYTAPPAASSSTFQRIAFVTTDASASASELVPNVLDAWRTSSTIALVGGRTYGKPVGQEVFTLPDCNTVLFLISFRLVNAVGLTDYYTGLPVTGQGINSNAPLCNAVDDLTHEMDDPLESSTAAAVYFVDNGACPAAAGLHALAPASVRDQMVGAGSGPAARDMPGTF